MHVPARLFLIHFQVLDLFECLLKLLILLLNYLVDVLVMHIALLDLVLFAQNHRRNALVNLAQKSIQWVVVRVDFRDLLERVQIRQYGGRLIFDPLSDRLECFGRLCSHGRIIAVRHLHLVVVLNLPDDLRGDLLRLLTAVLLHNVLDPIARDIVNLRQRSCTFLI